MRHERLGALPQGVGECVGGGQRQSDGRGQCRQLSALKDLLLSVLAFRDVLRHDQRGGYSGKRDLVRRDIHVDDLAGLETVAPIASVLPWLPRLSEIRE